MTICVSFRISAAAVRASSCINLSNRSFPTSFRYFSENRLGDNYIAESNALARPCLISFVAIAKMFSTSTIIFTIMSAIASIGGTGIRLEVLEVLDGLEEIDQGVLADLDILGRLRQTPV